MKNDSKIRLIGSVANCIDLCKARHFVCETQQDASATVATRQLIRGGRNFSASVLTRTRHRAWIIALQRAKTSVPAVVFLDRLN